MLKKSTPILALVGAIAIVSLALYGFSQFNNPVSKVLGGGGLYTVNQTLAGTATQYTRLPNAMVNASATTTNQNAGFHGGVVRQDIQIDGITKFSLGGAMVGGTATSTFEIQIKLSQDGTNFFNITGNSTSTDLTGTSTLKFAPFAFATDPGTATTTFYETFSIPTAKYMRILFRGEDAPEGASGDLADGVKGFIQLGLEQGY